MTSGSLGGIPCHWIPNCIDPDALFPRGPRQSVTGRRSLGFVLGKSPDLLVSTLQRLEGTLAKDPTSGPVDLVVAGSGQAPPWSWGRTVVVGPIDDDTARSDFWSQVDIGLFVTVADNFPNTILEGLACGVPQVVPLVGGADEAVKLTDGGIATQETPEALAAAILQLLQDEPLRRRLGDSAAAGSKREYSLTQIGMRHKVLYERLVGKPLPRRENSHE